MDGICSTIGIFICSAGFCANVTANSSENNKKNTVVFIILKKLKLIKKVSKREGLIKAPQPLLKQKKTVEFE
ncbi:MAG: hypothetical protein M1445_17200 [Bacteroidetes bacterium]|nr:hypothetical protein [Bacteroidota bacterium]